MNKNKVSAFTAALLAAALMLSGCRRGGEADWEDTLPSAVTTASEKEVSVIEAETNPPISISVPETTTTTEKSTELATTTAPPETSEDRSSLSPVTSVTTTPNSLVFSESTSPASTTVPITDTTVTSSETTTLVTTETVITAAPVQRADGEYIYVKGSPIEKAYPYNTLDSNKKAAYDAMLTAIKAHRDRFDIPDGVKISGDDYVELYQLIYDFEYSIFDLDVNIRYTSASNTGNVVSAQLSYLYTAEQVDDMQKKIDAAADKIIS